MDRVTMSSVGCGWLWAALPLDFVAPLRHHWAMKNQITWGDIAILVGFMSALYTYRAVRYVVER